MRATYRLHAFLIDDKNKYNYNRILIEDDGQKSVRYIKGRFKLHFINIYTGKYRKAELLSDGFCLLPYNDLQIVNFPNENHFAILKTDSIEVHNCHSFLKVINVETNVKTWKNKFVLFLSVIGNPTTGVIDRIEGSLCSSVLLVGVVTVCTIFMFTMYVYIFLLCLHCSFLLNQTLIF